MPMNGQNRVVVGLPDRYEKAKKEIARMERRESLIHSVLHDYYDDAEMIVTLVKGILEGEHDE